MGALGVQEVQNLDGGDGQEEEDHRDQSQEGTCEGVGGSPLAWPLAEGVQRSDLEGRKGEGEMAFPCEGGNDPL